MELKSLVTNSYLDLPEEDKYNKVYNWNTLLDYTQGIEKILRKKNSLHHYNILMYGGNALDNSITLLWQVIASGFDF